MQYVLVVAFQLLISLTAFAGYTIKGVPDPLSTWAPTDFPGEVIHPITGVPPENWSAAIASGVAAYYIDSEHLSATNTDNPFGTPEKPRKTIVEATYSAGSYVEIHGGPYDGGGQLIITADGTPDKPVWIRGLDIDSRALISGETIIKGQYVFLENLEYRSPTKTISFRSHNSSNLHHAVIRNSIFIGDGADVGNSSAIAIYGSNPTNRFHDIVVYNNEISQFGNDFDDIDTSTGESKENDYHGVLPGSNVDRVWLVKNKIHHLGGDSVQVGVASTADENRPSHVYIVDNDFYTNLENGVDIKEADFTVIMNNRIWDWKKHKDNSSTGGAIIIHNTARNTWVINNEVSDAAVGIAATGSSLDTWVIGNIVKNIRHPEWDESWAGGLYDSGGAIHFRGGSSGGAINNTIVDYDKGIEVAAGEYAFINNILFNRNVESGKDIFVESSQSINVARSNLIYTDSLLVKENNINCLSCLYQDPKFIDVIVDVNIADDSPAVGTGFVIDNYLEDYKTIFGVEITKDIYGNNRISGGVDIGAVKNQDSTTETVESKPLPPKNLNVSVNQ